MAAIIHNYQYKGDLDTKHERRLENCILGECGNIGKHIDKVSKQRGVFYSFNYLCVPETKTYSGFYGIE